MDRGFSCVGRSLYLSAARFPDKPALVEIGGSSLTYKKLNDSANQLGNHMLALGVSSGDHVAMLSDNSLEHVVALYALVKIGGVSVVLDPKWTPSEVGRTLDFFDCKYLIIDTEFLDRLSEFETGKLEFGMLVYEKNRKAPELLKMVGDSPAVEPDVGVLDHDPFSIMLTSGTTGFPKGCIRTHRNVEIGCMNGAVGKGLDDSSRELVVVPIYYGSGRSSIMGQVYIGGTVFLQSPFDPEHFADTIQRQSITATALAPTMCSRLLKLPNLENYDFSSLQALRKAGSPFTTAMIPEMIGRLTPHIFQGYASTESGGVTLLRPEQLMTKIGSAGMPRWGVDIQLVGSNDEQVVRGEEGEIRVRGPNVCNGYYKNPDEQAKVFRNGWFYTGDIGRIDEDGHLFIVGRIKDLIKTGSINVAPREIESTILNMKGVEDAAVIGVPHQEWGEAVKAYVVLRDGVQISPEDIVLHCKKTLASYKVPKFFEFTDKIERDTLGKLTAKFRRQAPS